MGKGLRNREKGSQMVPNSPARVALGAHLHEPSLQRLLLVPDPSGPGSGPRVPSIPSTAPGAHFPKP